MEKRTLEFMRREIDAVDKELAMLLARRFAIAKAIGQSRLKSSIKDESRENEVLLNIRQSAGKEFAGNAAAVYLEIIKQSRKVQE